MQSLNNDAGGCGVWVQSLPRLPGWAPRPSHTHAVILPPLCIQAGRMNPTLRLKKKALQQAYDQAIKKKMVGGLGGIESG